MLDEESQRILVSKKIAQLVKLIDHLNFQNAQRNFKIDCETLLFEKQLLISQQENIKSLNKINDEIIGSQNTSEQNQKSEFQKQYNDILSDYEIQVVSCQSDLTEASISFSREISNLKKQINSINVKIDEYTQNLNDKIDQKHEIFHQQISKINKKHQSVLDALDKESEEKLNSLQEQTRRKLDSLDRDFNRSLTNLKAKFGHPELDSTEQAQLEISFSGLKENLVQLDQSINLTQQEINFILSNSKAIFQEYKSRINSLVDELNTMNKTGQSDIKKLEKELKEIEINHENINNEYESKRTEMILSFQSLQNIMNDLQQSNSKEIEEKELLTDLTKRKTKESGEFICQEIEKDISLEEEQFNKDKESYQNIFRKYINDIETIQAPIQNSINELEKLKQIHQSEQTILSASQNAAIEEFTAFNENEKKELIHSNDSDIGKQIDENRQILNTLLFEHASLLSMNGIINDTEREKTKDRYEKERKELILELERELETVVEEEKTLIDLQIETHRHVIFEKNTTLANKYDCIMSNIRESFQQNHFKDEINLEYRKLIEKLNNELHILEISNKQDNSSHTKILDNEIEKYKNLAQEAKEKYAQEKKKINKNYLFQQKNEEDRYLKRLAEINYKSEVPHEEYETVREEFHRKLQKLDLKIKDSEIELAELKGNESHAMDKLILAFDEKEKKMKELLELSKSESETSIQKYKKKMALKKKDILAKINKIKNKLKKFHQGTKQQNDEWEGIIRSANEETLEESEKLHQKVEAASNRLLKHFHKQNSKLTKEHEKNLQEINEKISNQKRSNEFLNEELAKITEKAKKSSENQLESLKKDVESHLKDFKDENDAKIQLLDELFDQTVNKLEQLKIDVIDGKSREEELNIIERLETHLKIQENQLQDCTKCIKDYKKKLVQQEGVYNSHFGTQPSVAVLRPTTPAVSIPINKRLKQQRPVTASLQMRPMSFLKNRTTKNDLTIKKNDVSVKKKEITVT